MVEWLTICIYIRFAFNQMSCSIEVFKCEYVKMLFGITAANSDRKLH